MRAGFQKLYEVQPICSIQACFGVQQHGGEKFDREPEQQRWFLLWGFFAHHINRHTADDAGYSTTAFERLMNPVLDGGRFSFINGSFYTQS